MKNLKSLAIVALFAGSSLISFGQEKEVKTPEQRAEKKTEILTKKLDLNANQQTKVAEMNLKTAKEVDAIKSNQNLSKEEKKNAVKQLRETKQAELRGVLSSDQQQKFDKMKEKREQKREKIEKRRQDKK
jgi:protein CpxP